MYILKDRYQDTLGDSIWDYKLSNGKSFKSTTISQVVSLISQLKIIGRKAEGLGITLTSDEREEIRQYVSGLFSDIDTSDINKYLLDVPVSEITAFESAFFEFLDTKYSEVPANIASEKVISEETEAILKKAIEEFKQTRAWK